mmetsp:Transcript_25600/g.19366  ORF Transcript_25600/g.19366 Transcript_25600/m.19366 type:complete len:121 (-) Transcript_25600:619-981(-)
MYKGNLIIVGGEQKYNWEIRQRESYCDVWSYSPLKNEFTMLNIGSKLICEPRKEHAMALVGPHMLVHGGINNRGYFIDDICCFNMVNNEWSQLSSKGQSPGAIAFHKCVAVYKKDRKLNP